MTPERLAKLRSVLRRRQPDLTIITDYVHKGRNLSAIVRTADAVGISAIHCVIGDKDYRVFRGTSLGSHRWVEVHRHTCVEGPVMRLKAAGFQVVAAHLSAEAVDFHAIDYTRPTVLLLGAEKEGVSESGIRHADVHVTIPMMGMVESFNVSVAAGIILTEAQRQRQQAGLYDGPRLDQATYDQLFFEWAHPAVAEFCHRHRLAYPPLGEDGELLDPAEWHATMKTLIARREPQEREENR